MQYNDLLAHRDQIISIFKVYGVENPRVFGSVINGSNGKNSDIDFLVSWPKRHSLFDRIRLKRELESLLQNKVDLITEKSLYPRIRDEVIRSAKPL